MTLWNDIANLLSAPFAGPVSIKQLFWIVGITLIIAAFWFFVLEHMRQAGQVVGEAI